MALAYAWEESEGWPREVEAGLSTSEDLGGAELLLALPEHETPLRGGSRPSQSDVFALGRTRNGEQVAIAVEGKVNEPFGTETVAEWRENGGAGKRERLAQLCDLLDLSDDETLAGLRYQLLHRTGAAVLEAQRFGARHALMLVHSFSSEHPWFDDYSAFSRRLGAEPAVGAVVAAQAASGTQLHLGWVTGEIRQPSTHTEDSVILSERFDKAVALARTLHGGQVRKGTAIPYLAHLLAVAALVLEDGGDEDEAIAALLHDAVEDQGGARRLDQIRQLFGHRVADIVDGCTDAEVEPKPPWRQRKERYLEHLRQTDRYDVLRVSLADKLHNARAIVSDLREQGPELWRRFTTGSAKDQLWYYGELVRAFEARRPGRMTEELRLTVEEMERLAAS